MGNYDLEFIGWNLFWCNILGLLASTVLFLSLDYLDIISKEFDSFSIVYGVLLAVQILSIMMIKIGKKRNETVQEDEVTEENES